MTSAGASSSSPSTGRPPSLIISVLGFCGITVALLQTLIVPLVPILPRILHASAADASWAITATLLVGAVATPIAGRLGDMYGKRRVLLWSMVTMIVGSVLCAVTSDLVTVVIGRGLQGASMGIIPLGISILRDELPDEKVGSAIAIMSATMGVGGAIGMPVAAVIAEKTDWHTLFWVSALLGLVAMAAVLVWVPESPVKSGDAFDYVGALGLSASLVALLLAITKGNDWGWASATTLGLFATAVVVGVLWGLYELRSHRALIDLRISAGQQVLFTNMASIAIGFAMYGMSLIPSQLLMAPEASGYGMGLSMVQAGLILTPGGLAMFACSPLSAKISARSGPRVSLMVGALIIMLGYGLTLLLRSNPWEIMLAMMVVGAGIGIAYAAMPALIMGAVPISQTGAANGLNSLMRALGTSLSSAVVSVVLAASTMRVGRAVMPTESAFTVAIGITIAACVFAIGLALVIPRRMPHADLEVAVPEEAAAQPAAD